MPRRREFKGVAWAMLGSFVSRHNDVEGYWGMGRLRTHANAARVESVEVDLIAKTIDPQATAFRAMIEHSASALDQQLRGRGLPRAWLKSARIKVDFTEQTAARQVFETAQGGTHFVCGVYLEDDLRRPHRVQTSGRCRLTDRAREKRRLRGSWLGRRSIFDGWMGWLKR